MSSTLTPMPLRRLIAAKRKVDAAESHVTEARAAFVEALRAAVGAGYSQADAARACGLTRARISQILGGRDAA